jgi:hypothetical protein
MKIYTSALLMLLLSCTHKNTASIPPAAIATHTEEKAAASPSPQPELPFPDRVVLLRHGEDINRDSDQGLTREGLARADRLAALMPKWPVLGEQIPAAIFATSLHTVQTVKPSASKLDLPLIVLHKPARFEEWVAWGNDLQRRGKRKAKYFPDSKDVLINVKGLDRVHELVAILQRPEYRGKTVVVCWVHEEIKQLVEKLGYSDVPEWPKLNNKNHIFDRFWVLNLRHDRRNSAGKLHFDPDKNTSLQNLLDDEKGEWSDSASSKSP